MHITQQRVSFPEQKSGCVTVLYEVAVVENDRGHWDWKDALRAVSITMHFKLF